jgi:sentrin-specific protease 1
VKLSPHQHHPEFKVRDHKQRRAVSQEEGVCVRLAMRNCDRSAVVAQMEHVLIDGADVRTLGRTRWLNDNIINFFRACVQRESDGDGSHARVWITNTHFYSTLVNSGYASARAWSNKVNQGPGAAVRSLCANIFELDVMVIPIHTRGSHWCCGAINFKQRRVEVYDSLVGGNGPPNVFGQLRDYLRNEWFNKVSSGQSTLDLSEWVNYLADDVPKQTNGYDCGVFTCEFIKHLTVGGGADMPWDFSQADVPCIRNQMVRDIVCRKCE